MVKAGSAASQEADKIKEAKMASMHVPDPRRFDGGINFTLHKANGGYVVEYRAKINQALNIGTVAINKYSDVDVVRETKLHIITSDQDLGQQLSHIITYEALQQ